MNAMPHAGAGQYSSREFPGGDRIPQPRVASNELPWVSYAERSTPPGLYPVSMSQSLSFSVSASNLETVRTYIGKQAEHHARVSFQDEFRAFLEKHGLAFDERYVWD